VRNLSSLVLFGALVVLPRFDTAEEGSSGQGLVVGAFGRARRSGGWIPVAVGGAALLAVPAVLDRADLRQAHVFAALAVIFVSIVCITGFSGHLTLGQASIAGLGGFFSARAANALGVPVLVAMLVGAGAALVAGLIAGYPALRRKGLFLGLTTLGLALLIDRFVFNTELEFLRGGPGGLTVTRPSLFGLDLSGDVAFYYYELAVLAIVLFLVRNLRSGRLGRVLGAMRDSDVAAASVGIGLRRAKLFVFAVSSAIAGVGGAVLTQAGQNWDNTLFNPVFGLFWFTAVFVCGVSSTGGALLAAALYVAIPHITGQDVQSAIGLFGLGAVVVGRLPGGLAGQVTAARDRLLRRLAVEERARPRVAVATARPSTALVPSPLAHRLLRGRR
jgi:branched-chain amino acid transport system permease protein